MNCLFQNAQEKLNSSANCVTQKDKNKNYEQGKKKIVKIDIVSQY